MVVSFVVLDVVCGSSGCVSVVLQLCVCDCVFVVVCWLRSGSAQCGRELAFEVLAVEVRRGTLPSGTRG